MSKQQDSKQQDVVMRSTTGDGVGDGVEARMFGAVVVTGTITIKPGHPPVIFTKSPIAGGGITNGLGVVYTDPIPAGATVTSTEIGITVTEPVTIGSVVDHHEG